MVKRIGHYNKKLVYHGLVLELNTLGFAKVLWGDGFCQLDSWWREGIEIEVVV
jgi:hypothetical protein